MAFRWWPQRAKIDYEQSNIGNVLVLMGALSEKQLKRGIDEHRRREDMKIGKIFVEQGAITKEMLAEAVELQKEMRRDKTAAMLTLVEKKTEVIRRQRFVLSLAIKD